MRKIIIEVPEPGDEDQSLDVVLQDGRRCGGLCWGEMVEQIAGLTLNKEASTERYRMLTSEEWEALRTLRKARTQQLPTE